MKTEKEIHKFYAQTILPGLKHLELKRRKIHAILKVFNWLILAFWIALNIIFLLLMEDWIEAVRTAFTISFVAYAIVFYYLTHQYKKQVENKIVGQLIRFLMPNLRIEPHQKVPKGTYLRSALFPHKISRYRGQNFTTGRIGSTSIEFSELEVTVPDSEDSHIEFEGLFFVADFNKHFRTRTIVLPDLAESLLGSFGQNLQSLNLSRPPLVKLENSEFEKQFVVYADDQIEARYILSPALMDRILRFQKKHNKHIYLSFVDHRIFIAISSIYPLFIPKVSVSLFDYKQIEGYCEILQMTLDVVDELNLNTRIWTKQ